MSINLKISNTGFKNTSQVDIAKDFITNDYFISIYPDLVNSISIGIPPELWVWGNNSGLQLGINSSVNSLTPVTTFTGGSVWKQVSAGNSHTTAIKIDGTLWTWGSNGVGELGTNDTLGKSTPVTTFVGGNNWKQTSSGNTFSAAIKTDGSLWTWGNGDSGRLGLNDTLNRSTPVIIQSSVLSWRQVSAGNNHIAAIEDVGDIWTWGNNSNGQLGLNDTVNRSVPNVIGSIIIKWKDVSSASEVDLYSISTNGGSTAILANNGELYMRGDNSYGQLGKGDIGNKTSTPITTFAGGTNWRSVSVGGQSNVHTLAIKTDGTLWVWGSGTEGCLGNGLTSNNIPTPITTFAGGTNWRQVSSGYRHVAAIKTDGTLWVWGNNSQRQLADLSAVTRSTPVTTFAGGTNWKYVNVGSFHTSAIKTDGTLWLWGNNGDLVMGNGTTTGTVATPITTFAGGTNWKQVSAGGNSVVAIKTDGTLWTWGRNTLGQLGDNTTINRSTPVTTFAGGTNWKQVSCGGGAVAAIKTDGTLWVWGNNYNSYLGISSNNNTLITSTPVTTFVGGTNWTQVHANISPLNGFNYGTMIALRSDFSVWGWGFNYQTYSMYVQSINNYNRPLKMLEPNFRQDSWKQVSSGNSYTAAISTLGTLWMWGSGADGKLGNASTIDSSTPITTFAGGTNWRQVSCGGFHITAIKTDGTLWTWGNGSNGRLGNASTTNNSTPVTTFAGGTKWKQTSGGSSHTSALKVDGTLWTWGAGGNGRLGVNSTIDISTPITTFVGSISWKQVSSGNDHTTAIRSTDFVDF